MLQQYCVLLEWTAGVNAVVTGQQLVLVSSILQFRWCAAVHQETVLFSASFSAGA